MPNTATRQALTEGRKGKKHDVSRLSCGSAASDRGKVAASARIRHALKTHKRFEKDARLASKRGKDMDKLWRLVAQIQADQPLAVRHRPHRLTGDWAPYMEGHIEPDWLLIYLVTGDTLQRMRTGTHAYLFD